MRDQQRVVLVPVVVSRQPRRLLVGCWRQVDARLGAVAMVLLATRNECLFEPTANALAPGQNQFPIFDKENPLRIRCAKPLEIGM